MHLSWTRWHVTINSKGELLLARDAAMKARALYEAKLVAQPHDSKLAGALADLLTWASPQDVDRTPSRPSCNPTGGAKIELLEDGSIFVRHGNNAQWRHLHPRVPTAIGELLGLRLEVLSPIRLPSDKGPGRHSDRNFSTECHFECFDPSGLPIESGYAFR